VASRFGLPRSRKARWACDDAILDVKSFSMSFYSFVDKG
jgi:hypothetical protein